MCPAFRSQLIGRRLRDEIAGATAALIRRSMVCGRDPALFVHQAIVVALDGPQRLPQGGHRDLVAAIAMYLQIFSEQRFDRKSQVAQEVMFDLVSRCVQSHVGDFERAP